MADKLPIVLRTNTLGSEELRATDNLSAGDSRIVNVGPPVDGTDAVNLDFLNTAINVAAFNVIAADISRWNQAYSWGNHVGLYDPIGSVTTHETTYDHTDIWGAGAENQLWTQGADGNPVSEANLTFDGTILKSPQYGSPNSIYLVPSGTYGIQVGTTGNARGDYSLDLQSIRDSDDEVASGSYSAILSGSGNKSTAAYATITSGWDNITSGLASTICGGRGNNAEAPYSIIAGGIYNTISGSNPTYTAIVGGSSNTITGVSTYSVICGGASNTITTSTNSLVSGVSNILTYSSNSTLFGSSNNIVSDASTTVSGNAISGGEACRITYSTRSAICGGLTNRIEASSTHSNSYCFVGGGTLNFITGSSNTCNIIVGGYANKEPTGTGDYNIIGGGNSNVLVAASTNNGYNSILGGQNHSIRGKFCTVGGGYNNDITLLAGCTYSTIVGGIDNTITSSYDFIGGGSNHSISANYSSIIGGDANTCSGLYSIACGKESVASRYGQKAQASGKFSSNGDAQTSILIARLQTTDDTPTELFLDGVDDRLTIPVSTSWFFTIKVIARQTNDDFSVNAYHIEGSCSRDAGNIAIDYQATITSNEEDATWDVTVSADTGNQSLKLQVTGATDNTINWVARIELVEVTG